MIPLVAAAGLAALEFYLGSWSCAVSARSGAPFRADVTFARDGAQMIRTAVTVPARPGHAAFSESQLTTWEANRGVFVQVSLGSDASWSVSEAAPWSGNVETWRDVATDDGTLRREELERVSRDRYVVRNYAALDVQAAAVTSDCRRR